MLVVDIAPPLLALLDLKMLRSISAPDPLKAPPYRPVELPQKVQSMTEGEPLALIAPPTDAGA
jgi:hypothetical protein